MRWTWPWHSGVLGLIRLGTPSQTQAGGYRWKGRDDYVEVPMTTTVMIDYDTFCPVGYYCLPSSHHRLALMLWDTSHRRYARAIMDGVNDRINATLPLSPPRLMLVRLLGLLLGLVLASQLLLLILNNLQVLLGASRRLVAVRLGSEGGVQSSLLLGRLGLLLLLLCVLGIGDLVGERSLVLRVESGVRVLLASLVSLAGLGVAYLSVPILFSGSGCARSKTHQQCRSWGRWRLRKPRWR